MYVKDNELHLVWCIEDVQGQALTHNIELSDAECVEVLRLMLDRHDCNYGTSWDCMDSAIDTIVEERGKCE